LQASPQALVRILESRDPINPLLKLRFKSIFDRFENLVILQSKQKTGTKYEIKRNSIFDPAPDFLRSKDVDHTKTFSPLELIGTAILVSFHMDNRNDDELLEDIKLMRIHLRKVHKDLRVNAQCWVTVWEYIMDIEEERPSVSLGPRPGLDEPVRTMSGKTVGAKTRPAEINFRGNHRAKGKAPANLSSSPASSSARKGAETNGKSPAEITTPPSRANVRNGTDSSGGSGPRSSKRQRDSVMVDDSPKNSSNISGSGGSRGRGRPKRQREASGVRESAKKSKQ
jgi:hypothetical protein